MNADQPYHPDQDKGCLRWVLGVPLVTLHLLAAGACYYALTIRPANEAETDEADFGIAMMSVFVFSLSALALLITLVPSNRRALGRWWLVPPVALSLLASLRWAML
ncbi:hypothetical protein [Streptomyces sp. SYSU K21746]